MVQFGVDLWSGQQEEDVARSFGCETGAQRVFGVSVRESAAVLHRIL